MEECQDVLSLCPQGHRRRKKRIGVEHDYQASVTVNANMAKQKAEQKVQDNIADKMSGSFNALESAAVAKAEIIDNNTAVIALLTNITCRNKQATC